MLLVIVQTANLNIRYHEMNKATNGALTDNLESQYLHNRSIILTCYLTLDMLNEELFVHVLNFYLMSEKFDCQISRCRQTPANEGNYTTILHLLMLN